MELEKAKELANELIGRKHLLYRDGWRFEFDNAKRRLGCCNFTYKTISLSKAITLINDESIIRNTILHEIAHALVGRGHGHDWVWRQKALEIGCDGNRCCSNSVRVEGKYKAICNSCKKVSYAHREKKRDVSCGKCGNGKYNILYKLEFKINN